MNNNREGDKKGAIPAFLKFRQEAPPIHSEEQKSPTSGWPQREFTPKEVLEDGLK